MPAQVFVLKEAVASWMVWLQWLEPNPIRTCGAPAEVDSAATVVHVVDRERDGRWVCAQCGAVYPPDGQSERRCSTCSFERGCSGAIGFCRTVCHQWEPR